MLYDSENERIELPLSMAEELVGEIDAPISLKLKCIQLTKD